MTAPDQFEKLAELHAAGVLSDDEFNSAWSKLAAQQTTTPQQPAYQAPSTAGSTRHAASTPRFPVRWLAIGGAVIAAAIVLLVLQPWSSGSSGFTAHGVLDLQGVGGPVSLDESDLQFITNGSTCIGVNGYDDIVPGAQVAIADSTGKTLALGSLDGGTVGTGVCEFTFTVTDVPSGKKFYQVTVTHRGGLQFTETQLKAGISASLGS